tara:strand:+ start:198 stop:461 length:264 start_codon:yes stop_codon:yes gene_type:complete
LCLVFDVILNKYFCTFVVNYTTMTLVITFLGMIGGPQIILIIAVVLLLFGGRKIPELMKGLGSGIKEFKNATKEDEEAPKLDEDKKD